MGVSKVKSRNGAKIRWRARYGRKSLGFHRTKALAEAAVEHYKEFGNIDYEKQTRPQDVPDDVFEKEMNAIPANQPIDTSDFEKGKVEPKKPLWKRLLRR